MLGSICFFNNKGGVGKTTLACNVASYLAQDQHLAVLVVDADPQCNATQLILPDDLTQELYTTESNDRTIDSLREILSPLMAGDASLPPGFTPATPATNRFGVSVIPGHPQIALLEDLLSQNWTQFLGGNLGGARVSNWNTQFLRHMILEDHAYRFEGARPHFIVMPRNAVSDAVISIMEESMNLRALLYDPSNNHIELATSVQALVQEVAVERQSLTQTMNW